ncbi:hypothetical protein RKE30_16295 [Streptomyces sp. Li-HN-5-11]|uniref:hypothetical protein n=1 Tax=Streptomyces sp. Li-HN-5-11 TaxID=3075432 RepID=UPI0028AEA6C3|nr:hypothetical protein [Streptomyces sp. Li-HN-5-11]WNM31855.1 hypothetical protein RKE30_16295 [Streptomyces sp. Li-HN-5-11]
MGAAGGAGQAPALAVGLREAARKGVPGGDRTPPAALFNYGKACHAGWRAG